MSVHRAASARTANQSPQTRPFSTNNPFRNASLDSNINSVHDINQQHFQNWVQNNSSQLSFSEDDEESFPQMPPPRVVRPSSERSTSQNSIGSGYSASRMTGQRRASNNPFQRELSAESTGDSNSPPTYPVQTKNNDYYTSTAEEKQRLRERERESERQRPEELPPSYEEAAGPNATKEYPKEKSSSSHRSRSHSSSNPGAHRTRVHREYQGETPKAESTHRSSRPSEHRSKHRSEKERLADRERRHKDREGKSSSHRHRSSSDKKKTSSKDEKPPKNVDTIDKLDVTGLFGGAFHHDGPFDACTPHRNKNSRAAPVLAFPADGPNSSIRGSSSKSFKDQTISYINGYREDDDDDLYTTAPAKTLNGSYQRSNNSQDTLSAIKANQNIIQFDTKVKADPVHGETTLGLGSSTFLDGAPAAANAAIYDEAQKLNAGGLNRKKSLKQRLVGGANETPKPKLNTQSNVRGFKSQDELNDENHGDAPVRYGGAEKEDSPPGGNSLLKRVKSLKVGKSKS